MGSASPGYCPVVLQGCLLLVEVQGPLWLPDVMAESRRVQLTTLYCGAPSYSDQLVSAERPPSGSVCSAETQTDTVRLVLALFEPDERSFPEFSYSQLIDNKINPSQEKVPLSRFEEEEERENDEVAVIARRLEEKYGGQPKKKDRIQDLIDIGYGYDEEDSFIDNSEAYDEFVPASITTKFGGFYVNSGLLQFRQASDADAETEDLSTEEKMLKSSKKRKLNGGQVKPKKKRCSEGGDIENNVDPKSSTLFESGMNREMKKKKKKKATGTLSVTNMLKKFQREKQKERQKMKAAAVVDVPSIPVCPADAAGGGGLGLTDPLLNLIGSTNEHALIQAASTMDFDIDLDSLLDVSEEMSSPKLLPHPATETELFQATDNQSQLDVSAKAQTETIKTNLQPEAHPEQIQLLPEATSASPHECVPLPQGLPPGLEQSIRKLMVAAKTSKGESKLKFFTPEINSILLDIELQCREQGGPLRSKVYTHMSSFLPCSRDTLLKRVKKLLVTHREELPDVEDPMQKLKMAIGRAMPAQIEHYRGKCNAYKLFKASKATEEGKDANQSVSDVAEDNVEEKGGKRGGPRKLFTWNEEIRECLCHVLRSKMDRHKEKKGSQEMEEYLKMVLDNEVKPLWPKGWMQSRVLMRESSRLVGPLTSLQIKARPEKRKSSANGPSTVLDVLQGTPPLKGELQQQMDICTDGSDITNLMPHVLKEAAAVKKGNGTVGQEVTVGAGSSSSLVSEEALVNISAPTHSLLDLLSDQALAQEQTLTVPQELLAAAVAKCTYSVPHWSFRVDGTSSPLPPPPPQSSPISFPATGVCQEVLPQLLQVRDFVRHMDAGYVQVVSDKDDIAMQ
ncbi:ubinuclein-1 isoform X2 [Mastacembelus armatus]|uniref:ubinuclein-1 isoform X2 n=1 Tax=Mastacembelus armatus TaxID=205130 RepID=UPI000E45BD11|nr:ubinuclein-1 isoform X2 [Mastacembelus armatus]